MSRIRVLVVDDSPLLRRIIVDMITAEVDLEVVGQARNGEEAVRLVAELRPDVVTMDVEMPRMNGLEALRAIMAATPTPVLMVSTLTAEGAHAALEALEYGAVDCLEKPAKGAFQHLDQIRGELVSKIRAARHARVARKARPAATAPAQAPSRTDHVVLIAASTGGPKALSTLFESLPKGFPAPVLVVQHMPPGFVATLAKRLDALGTVPCAEAAVGDSMQPGRALIAPSGTHMRVRPDGRLQFDAGPTLHGVRPAADFLFHSAAEAFGARCVAAVLTGMGRDGAEGALAVHQVGGVVLAECESSAVIYGMPRAAVAIGAVDREVPIERMGEALVGAISGFRKVRLAS